MLIITAVEISDTVKPVSNGISRVQNIFQLKPGFCLIKVYYDNWGLKIFPFKAKFLLIKGPFKTSFFYITLLKMTSARELVFSLITQNAV
jgi:hypothetical protein